MTHLNVGQAEAVEVLTAKSLDLLDQFDTSSASRRLRHAISRGQRRYRQVHDRSNRGFYHGLITGYAVALKVLQGKVSGMRSR
ncbi:MAG TPA: hypothetical protein VK881_12840 [bacterium]|nr:hypothetical protein [bacterium]